MDYSRRREIQQKEAVFAVIQVESRLKQKRCSLLEDLNMALSFRAFYVYVPSLLVYSVSLVRQHLRVHPLISSSAFCCFLCRGEKILARFEQLAYYER